jgi:molybdopterin molybdotransferase
LEKPFLEVARPGHVLEKIAEFKPLGSEIVELEQALHRTLFEEIVSREDIPGFNRSTMDGYAVRASDTFGASEGAPALLDLKGEIPMGVIPEQETRKREAYKIWTGGALPRGADAVVMLEHVEVLDQDTIEALNAVAPFENVVRRGEDIEAGKKLLASGQRLRPGDLGALAAIGAARIKVYARPRVALISSGDEITPVEENPKPGHMRDVNRICVSSLTIQAHAQPVWMGIAKDELASVTTLINRGLSAADLVVISGGSSMGARDLVIEAITGQEDSEALVHGVSISPGKPFILAKAQGKPVIGLPGHPVSAMVCFESLVVPLLRRLEGERAIAPYLKPSVRAILSRNLPSKEGRLDFIRVRLDHADDMYRATPIMGKSGMITTMSRAHGYVMISEDCEGLYKGEKVEVSLFSDWIDHHGI